MLRPPHALIRLHYAHQLIPLPTPTLPPLHRHVVQAHRPPRPPDLPFHLRGNGPRRLGHVHDGRRADGHLSAGLASASWRMLYCNFTKLDYSKCNFCCLYRVWEHVAMFLFKVQKVVFFLGIGKFYRKINLTFWVFLSYTFIFDEDRAYCMCIWQKNDENLFFRPKISDFDQHFQHFQIFSKYSKILKILIKIWDFCRKNIFHWKC